MNHADQEIPRPSVSSLQPSSPNLEPQSEDNYDIQESNESQPEPSPTGPSHRQKKRNRDEATNAFLIQATAALKKKSDDCDAFICLTTNKLRRMTEQWKLVEPLLLQLYNKVLRGEITTNTYIADYTSYS
ncbi:uncharacterized protein LOC143974321 [Lithobates pipiens]